MLRRVKDWLGIEGVKIELVLPERIAAGDIHIKGFIRFKTKHSQTVHSVRLRLMEKYSRGRRKNKLIDEYVLAEKTINTKLKIPENDSVDLDFELPFEMLKSKMDQFADKNIFTKNLAKVAKKMKGVRSEFRIEAEANVAGTALNPIDSKDVVIL